MAGFTMVERVGVKRAGSLAALGILLSFAGVTPAFAHAHLTASVPEKDATVSAPLTEVVLTFTEAVTPAMMQILDQDGHNVKSVGKPHAEGTTLHLPITAQLPDGHYTVTWRVAGTDTHVVTGSLAFAVAKSAP